MSAYTLLCILWVITGFFAIFWDSLFNDTSRLRRIVATKKDQHTGELIDIESETVLDNDDNKGEGNHDPTVLTSDQIDEAKDSIGCMDYLKAFDKKPFKNLEDLKKDYPQLISCEYEKRSFIPEESGIYFMVVDGDPEIRYLGKSKNLRSRLASHDRALAICEREKLSPLNLVFYYLFIPEHRLDFEENSFYKEYLPRYNRQTPGGNF